MADININLKAKDDASLALQSATADAQHTLGGQALAAHHATVTQFAQRLGVVNEHQAHALQAPFGRRNGVFDKVCHCVDRVFEQAAAVMLDG